MNVCSPDLRYAATLGLVDVRYIDSNVALDDCEDFCGTQRLTGSAKKVAV
ncbi:hypothetical protein [Paeniglutamicibacter gangotriensis]|nr:hypothetical protein [Paeniglutamicibacter gangotriensis]